MIVKFSQINVRKSKFITINVFNEILKHKIDIVCLQEPALNKTQDKVIGIPSNCTAIIYPNFNKRSRAAIVVLNSSISILKRPDLSDQDFAVCDLVFNNKRFLTVSGYFPEIDLQLKQPYDLNLDIIKLSKVLSHSQDKNIIVCLDSNSRSSLWGDIITNKRGAILEEWIISKEITLLNNNFDIPTFYNEYVSNPDGSVVINKSFIDLTLVKLTNCDSREWNITDKYLTADHRLITFQILFDDIDKEHRKLTTRLFNTSKANWPIFEIEIGRRLYPLIKDIANCINKDKLNSLVAKCNHHINESIRRAIPPINLQEYKAKNLWYDHECAKAKKLLNSASRQYKAANNPLSKAYLFNEFINLRKSYKKLLEFKNFNSYKEFVTPILDDNERPVNHWNLVKIFKKNKKQPMSAIKKLDGTYTSNLDETAIRLLDHFIGPANVVTHNNPEEPFDEYATSNNSSNQANGRVECSQYELNMIINHLNNDKAPGYDGYSAEIIKHIHLAIPLFYKSLFEKCLEICCYPDLWKLGFMILIPKPCKRLDEVSGWRPITLLPIHGKILERLIVNRTTKYLYLNKLMNLNQYGFTPQRSTVTAIHDLLEVIRQKQSAKNKIIIVSLDITGAFDCINHNSIINSLSLKRLPANLIKIIKDSLSGRSVSFNLGTSTFFRTLTKGCPQGASISPMLWNIAFDQLLNKLEQFENCHSQGFADDLIVCLYGDELNQLVENCNIILNEIYDWGKANGLIFNPSKTQAMSIGINQDIDLFMNNNKINLANKIKFLGVFIDNKLSFSDHVDYVINKAKKTFTWLNQIANNTWGFNPKLTRVIYTVCIEPIITYASPIWFPNLKQNLLKKINSTQRLFLIKIVKAYRTISYNKLYVLAGVKPIELLLKERNELFKIKLNNQVDLPNNGKVVLKKPIKWYLKVSYKDNEMIKIIENDEEKTRILDKNNSILKIFTDGSKSAKGVGAGVAFYLKENCVHELSLGLDHDCSVYTAELTAIEEALELITTTYSVRGYFTYVLICTDSKSCIDGLKNYFNLDEQICRIQNEIRRLIIKKNIDVYITWVKSHSGIAEHNHADRLAKNGRDSDIIFNKMSEAAATKKVKKHYCDKWLNLIDLNKLTHTEYYLPDELLKYLTKLIDLLDFYSTQFVSGHGAFNEYLYRFTLAESGICNNCNLGVVESPEHLLFSCVKFNRLRVELLHKNDIFNISDLKNLIDKPLAIVDFKKFCKFVIQNRF